MRARDKCHLSPIPIECGERTNRHIKELELRARTIHSHTRSIHTIKTIMVNRLVKFQIDHKYLNLSLRFIYYKESETSAFKEVKEVSLVLSVFSRPLILITQVPQNIKNSAKLSLTSNLIQKNKISKLSSRVLMQMEMEFFNLTNLWI